ncbi:MAG: DUF2807 domain-containing protein [Pseudomonadota bacterium]
MNSVAWIIGMSASVALTAAAHAESTRSYDLPAFNRIDVSAGIELVAQIGEAQKVEVYSEYGDFSDFSIRVRDGELIASRQNSRLRWHANRSDYEVRVTTPSLTSLEASSGSWGEVSDIDSGNFQIDLSSGASMEVSGECGDCNIDLSSGAHLKAEQLSCVNASIDVSSGGHGKLTVRDAVLADASSGGHVRVYGNPARVNVDKSSGGVVKIVRHDQIYARDE